jgi:hypothetical protein
VHRIATLRLLLIGAASLQLGLLLAPGAQAARLQASPTWAQAFGDVHSPIHLLATYSDAQGRKQPLEFWRSGVGEVRRRTGNRAELWLQPAQDGADQYQLRNLLNRTAFDVHRVNLFRVGVFTDRWSVQRLLDRPAGKVQPKRLGRQEQTPAGDCEWWSMVQASGVSSQVCWSVSYGVPLLLKAGGRTVLSVRRVTSLSAFPSAALPKGWQHYNADEDLSPD